MAILCLSVHPGVGDLTAEIAETAQKSNGFSAFWAVNLASVITSLKPLALKA